MSLDATIWAWKQEITSTQKLVLLSLADRAGENDGCYPSIKRLVHDTCLNRKTVQRAIKAMAESGLISYNKTGFGKANSYKLIGVQHREDKSHDVSQGPTKNHNKPNNGPIDKNTSNKPKKGPSMSPKLGSLKSPKLGYQSTIEPSIESLKEKNIKKESLIDCFSDDEKPLVQILIDHRQEIKKPLDTERATRMLIKKLNHYASEWNISLDDTLDFWLGESWMSIDVSYDYPFRSRDKSKDNQPNKGTVDGMSDVKKARIQMRINENKIRIAS
jgi:hypothetical protein